jgi:dolichyl-phosphate mannosyltransferase polypeptide 3
MPSRAAVVLFRLLSATAVWLALWRSVPLPPLAEQAVALLPLWLLLGFALYSAVTVIWSVATFPACPAAALELQREVEEARADLRKRGVLPMK